MSQLILPRRFYSQPQEAVEIDWSNPITSGLLVAFNFSVGPINLVNGEQWTATSMSSVASPLGKGLQATSSSVGNITGPTMNMARLPGVPNDVLSVCWGLGNVALANWRQMWGQNNGVADAALIQFTSTGSIESKFGGGAAFNTAAGSLISGESCHLALMLKATAGSRLIKNGTQVLYNSASLSYPFNSSAVPHIFGSAANTRRLDTKIPYWYMFGRVLSDEEVFEIASNPWQLFRAKPRVLYFDVGGGISGTLAVTLENFISSITGTTTVTGTVNNTIDNVTSSITGTTGIVGTISNTLENNTSSIVGTVSITGTISNTIEDFTSSISGALGQNVSGTISVTIEDNTSTITGSTAVTGTITVTVTLADATLDGTTTVLGTITQQMENFTSSIYGFTGAVGIQARLRTLLGMGT